MFSRHNYGKHLETKNIVSREQVCLTASSQNIFFGFMLTGPDFIPGLTPRLYPVSYMNPPSALSLNLVDPFCGLSGQSTAATATTWLVYNWGLLAKPPVGSFKNNSHLGTHGSVHVTKWKKTGQQDYLDYNVYCSLCIILKYCQLCALMNQYNPC